MIIRTLAHTNCRTADYCARTLWCFVYDRIYSLTVLSTVQYLKYFL